MYTRTHQNSLETKRDFMLARNIMQRFWVMHYVTGICEWKSIIQTKKSEVWQTCSYSHKNIFPDKKEFEAVIAGLVADGRLHVRQYVSHKRKVTGETYLYVPGSYLMPSSEERHYYSWYHLPRDYVFIEDDAAEEIQEARRQCS